MEIFGLEEISDSILEEFETNTTTNTNDKLVSLQNSSIEFITSTIVHNEKSFYKLIEKISPNKLSLLTFENPSIIEMIRLTTNDFYNQIYSDLQNQVQTPLTTLVKKISGSDSPTPDPVDMPPHILLGKLININAFIHLNLNRTKISIIDIEQFELTILSEINEYVQKNPVINMLIKGPDDNALLVNIPPGEKAFNIVIKK